MTTRNTGLLMAAGIPVMAAAQSITLASPALHLRAGGTAADFRIYNEQFFGGMTETVVQNAAIFNEASRGAIRIVDNTQPGDYIQESFFKEIAASSLIQRRDPDSTDTVDDEKLEQEENATVKVHRRIGPVANTRASFLEIDERPTVMSFILGQQFGAAAIVEQVNVALGVATAAISGQASNVNNITAAPVKTISASGLNNTLRKMGDAASDIVAWVMHSQSHFDLVQQAIGDKIFEEAGLVVYGGAPGTLNRPVVVTDSPNLINTTPDPDEYNVLGLREGALEVRATQERYVTMDEITGRQNITMRLQGEYAYNVGVTGFTWDIANGGKNPTDASLFTSSNWDMTATNQKNLAGTLLVHQLLG